jgi:hypothetical protein
MSGTHTPLSFQSGGPDRYARLDKFGNLEVCNLSPGTTSGAAALTVNDLIIQGNTSNTAAAPGQYGIALGAGTTSGTTLADNGTIAIGYLATALQQESIAIGQGAFTHANVKNSIAIGAGAACLNPSSPSDDDNQIAIGETCTCSGLYGVAVGAVGRCYAAQAVAIGAGASTGYRISPPTITNGLTGHVAIGFQAQVPTGHNGIAIGISADAENDNAISIGASAVAEALQSIAIGVQATAGPASNSVGGSIAIGPGTIAFATGAVAFGPYQSNLTANSVCIGAQSTTGPPAYDFLRLQAPSNVTQTGSLTGTVSVAGACGVITMFTYLGLANSYTFQVNCPYVGANSLVYLTVVRAGTAAINNTTSIPAGATVGSINNPAQSFTVTVWNPNAGVTIPIGSTGNFAVAYWVTNTAPA